MSGIKQRLIGLCLPAVLCFALDMTLTLSGQPTAYWAGNYSQFNEKSPFLGQLLQVSPLAFVAGCVAIASLGIAIILLLPDTLALIASISGVMGGTYGASTWLMYSMRLRYGYQLTNLLLLGSAILLGLCVRYGWRVVPEEAYRLPIGLRWRWLLTAILVAIAAWISLRPPSF